MFYFAYSLRYRIMRPFLTARGGYALDMMAMTGSTQASYDFSSEEDMGSKLRVALAIQPVVTALFANSPVVNGRESGWKSYRVNVWNYVDPARCGLPAFPLLASDLVKIAAKGSAAKSAAVHRGGTSGSGSSLSLSGPRRAGLRPTTRSKRSGKAETECLRNTCGLRDWPRNRRSTKQARFQI